MNHAAETLGDAPIGSAATTTGVRPDLLRSRLPVGPIPTAGMARISNLSLGNSEKSSRYGDDETYQSDVRPHLPVL